MGQYQAKIEYATGAIFIFGLYAPDLGQAIIRAGKIAPKGLRIQYVLPIPPRNERKIPENND